MPSWSLIRTGDGSPTLAHPVHGQACHSRAGAWQEARERYAQACRLRERAVGSELRLLDVGTGLGLNLAAALEALGGTGTRLCALTLELERHVIERTLELARTGELHAGAPPELARHHVTVLSALELALRDSHRAAPISIGALTLELALGDGRDTLARTPAEPRFDAVFLDPFSPRVDPALWERGFLGEVARRMQPAAVLSTYCSSLAVRATLASLGLALAPGGRVGTKAAGTLASLTPFELAFDPRTARRIARRSAALGAPG